MRGQKALFVTFEGIEGSGKTTIARDCVDKLGSLGIDAVYVQDPGGCPVSESIRNILLHTIEPIAPETELLLFCAARAQLVSSVIKPELESGKVVVSDRYIDSTVAYQGYGRGMDLSDISLLNDFACKSLVPEITILLDLPAETGLKRQLLVDRISEEHFAFHERVRCGFLERAAENPDRFHVIDASQPLDIVRDAVWEILSVFSER